MATKPPVDPFENVRAKIDEVGVQGLTEDEKRILQERYANQYAIITLDPELTRIFIDMVEKGATATAMQLAFENSTYFRKRLATQLAYERDKQTNPINFGAIEQRVILAVKQAATKAAGQQIDDTAARNITDELFKNYYDGTSASVINQVDRFVTRRFATADKVIGFGGEIADNAMTVRQYARSMGLSIDDTAAKGYGAKIAAGDDTLENIQNTLRQQATTFFPQFKDRINAGEAVSDIVYPHRSMIANMLEQPIENIDIMTDDGKIDPILMKVLYGADDKGNPRVMSLTETRRAIKQDDRWQYTRNAESEYASLATELMRRFGAAV